MYEGVGVCHTIANLAMLAKLTVLKPFSTLPTTATRLTVTPAIQIFSSLSIISVHNFNPNAGVAAAETPTQQ